MKPVYIDGPLRGQRFDVDDQSMPLWASDESSRWPPGAGEPVLYQFRKFGFHGRGRGVVVNIGWCGGPEPDAEDIGRALFRDDVMERAEIITLPPGAPA